MREWLKVQTLSREGKMKYDTQIMKDDEVVLFCEAAMENGSGAEEAIADMRMIDAMLYMERLHLMVYGQVKKTAAGHYRKGTSLYDSLERILDGRLENKL